MLRRNTSALLIQIDYFQNSFKLFKKKVHRIVLFDNFRDVQPLIFPKNEGGVFEITKTCSL